jgi:hypothetical protein
VEPPVEAGIIAALRDGIPRAQEYLPFLSSNARVYVTAFTHLLGDLLRDGDEHVRDGLRVFLDGQWPDDSRFDRYMSLLHALMVTGLEEGIPPAVSTSLATGFWSSLRELVEGDEALAHADRALREAVRDQTVAQPVVDALPTQTPLATEGVLTRIRRRAGELSKDVWESIPADASERLDEYLYGR